MIVNIDEFMQKYTSAEYAFGAYIPLCIYKKILNSDSAFVDLPNNFDIQINKNKKLLAKRDFSSFSASKHWRAGLNYEIDNQYQHAAKEYYSALRITHNSCFDMSHIAKFCINRLIGLRNQISLHNE